MSRDELRLFSYEILGLVGREGAGPHDLLRMAKRGRMLAWAGESQYYTEPKRLAKLGYLTPRKEPGRTRERTVYTLTEKGLDALREYARNPVAFTPLKSDALLRLLDVAGLFLGQGQLEQAGDVTGRVLEEGAELAGRRAKWQAPAPPAGSHRGYLKLYLDEVLQAEDGCDFDFLRKRPKSQARA